MPPLRLLAFPLLGATIGWFTNWLAIRMLFRPRLPVRLLGLEFQGLIPRRRADLAHRLAEAITRDLLSGKDVAGLLGRLDWEGEVRHVLERVIEEDLGQSSLRRFPVVGPVADSLLAHVREALTREVTARLDRHKEAVFERIHERLDLASVIRDKVNAFDLERLEALVRDVVRRELRAIEALGGVIGFLLGSLQILLEVFA